VGVVGEVGELGESGGVRGSETAGPVGVVGLLVSMGKIDGFVATGVDSSSGVVCLTESWLLKRTDRLIFKKGI
jgi:hypothetical protein